MRTTGVWIDGSGPAFVAGPLAGWVTRPERTNGVAVVLLPAVGYGHSTGHRMLRVLAEALAARGCTAVRIDYPGTGDIAGDATVLSGLRCSRRR